MDVIDSTAGAAAIDTMAAGAKVMPEDPQLQRLGEIRERIDDIDEQIVALWNERANLGLQADEIKEQRGRDVLDGQREADVIAKVMKVNEGPLPHGFFVAGHTEGMREIRTLQRAARERRAAAALMGLDPDNHNES